MAEKEKLEGKNPGKEKAVSKQERLKEISKIAGVPEIPGKEEKETPKQAVSEKVKPAEEKVKEKIREASEETPKEAVSKQERVSGPAEAPKAEAPKELKNTVDFIALARSRAKPRKFVQSWDLCINLKGLNLKKPENRFNLDFALPEGRGKGVKIALFADSLAPKAREADLVIKKPEIEPLARDRKRLKKIVREYDWFFGEATLMVQIGKSLGPVLAPRGKMPRPIPPDMDPNPPLLSAKRNVRIQAKESPVLHIPIGSDRMEDGQVAKNLEAVFNFVRDKLPKGRANIKSVFVKLTMGPAVRVRMK